MRIGICSFWAAALFLCGAPACVGESDDAVIDERSDEPAAETSIDARSVGALGPGERMVVDLTLPGRYSIDNARGDLDLQRIDVRTRGGEITTLMVWLGDDVSFESPIIIDNASIKIDSTIYTLLSNHTLTLQPNTLRCFDVGWLPEGDSIKVDMSATAKVRVLVRRKVKLGATSWQNMFYPAASHETHVNQTYPRGYYQVCAKAASKPAAVALSFDAPTACGSTP